ncbi:MAG: squalene monooxygenase-like [Trebouxia sp. A1-2]|nr:MAG: squalene monooxygenase-like [Trebouxia sp. A1-2]
MGRGGEQGIPSISGYDHLSEVPSAGFQNDPEVWDLVVVGAGIAGSALAFSQGQAGRKVLLIERDLKQPDRIIGELLQPGGYLMLKRLGLAHCVYGYCIFKNGERAELLYPKEGFDADVSGRSFTHGRFVQRLRHAAASAPGVTVRQGTVKRLVNEQGKEWQDGQAVTGVLYKTSDDQEHVATANLTVVCDGMHSTLRKKLGTPDLRTPSHFVGLKLKGCSLPYSNFGHVVLANPSPLLFYPISSTEVRCLVDVPGDKLPSVASGALAAYLRETTAPQVPEQLRAAFLAAIDAGRLRSMLNKQMTLTPLHRPGALLLGDAFNMRHPLTGGGMTVALSDTKLLCDMLQPLPDFTDSIATANQTAEFYTKRKPLSATINTLANALYKYLKLGGIYSSGPISLLSGLAPKPSLLVMHFFMVALYGVGRLLRPRPTFKGVWMGVMLLYVASCIIFPIIFKEGIRAVFMPFLVRKPQAKAALSKLQHSVLPEPTQETKEM